MKSKTKSDAKPQPYYFRELGSVPFQPRRLPAAFRALCERILPRLRITGYKLEEKREVVMQTALALIRADLADKVVADTRDTRSAAVRQRKNVWDLLEEAGFCQKCLGSEQSRKVTRYRATKNLTALREFWDEKFLQTPESPSGPLLGLVGFKLKLDEDLSVEVPFEEVIRRYALRDANGQPDAGAVANGIAMTRVLEEFINQINGVNLDHSWKARNKAGVYFQPSVALHQLHIRKIWRGVRLYTRGELGGQSLSKEARARIRIDGQPVTELDISGSLLRLAYNLRGIKVSTKDIYAPERILPAVWPLLNADDQQTVRSFIKKATLICFYTNRRSAIGAVQKQLREHPLKHFPSAPELVNRIAFVHRKISSDLFSEDRSMELVTVEGQIMMEVLKQFVLRANKPALAVHDALVVRRDDAQLAQSIMNQTYFERTGFYPVIKFKSQTTKF